MSKIWREARPPQGPPAAAVADGGDGQRPRGRVLRVKDGYNPNSSSIGSAIPGFLTFAVASGAVAVLVMNVLEVTGRLLRKQQAAGPPSEEPPCSDGHPANDPAPPDSS